MATKRQTTTISTTKNYRLFNISEENRPLDLQKHGRLKKVMKKYGFLAAFPVVCVRGKDRSLVVKDGQHRLAIAEELGLPVHYVVSDVDFDIAEINCTAKLWSVRDYAEKHAANGVEAYQVGLEFCDSYGLPVSLGFSLLAGQATFGNCTDAFRSGRFVIREHLWAHTVASVYTDIVGMSKELKGARFAEACMAVCRIDNFDTRRLVQGAKRCRDKLISYSTRDAYLDMLETIYNFGRQSPVALKFLALQAMKRRDPTERGVT